ncbi:YncE family protein [Sphingomonas sp. AOB5]|uniref:YncE family protein n=1 Tax=Sphingomonas sp. AOB5 TaxID=3034017 RepID=UPI0023FA0501|nr:YncE family protein [Sphingomonas sp. AOB5]MDF7776302.1 YncE family protein [Sphingomonas sp. AOB5]
MRNAKSALAMASAVLGLCGGAANAQIAVSANDGKQPRLGQPATDVKPDTVAVIDLSARNPRVIATVEVPVSMIGPPTSIAMARDGSYAIVTASQKLDPADGTKFVPDGKVSVIDLTDPKNPKVVQTIEAGAGATGVAINRKGTLALVASVGDGTVSVFSISNRRLTLVGKVQLSAELGPCDVAISPDGKTALVTQRRGNHIWRLAIDGTKVTDTGITFQTGGNPYGSVFSPDSRYAYSTNLLGTIDPNAPQTRPEPGQPVRARIGTITAIDLRTNKIVTTVQVGPTPEHVEMSPDGRYIEVTVVNGSSANPSSSQFSPFGVIKVYRVNGASITPVAEATTGQWGQGATWSPDGRTILLQGAVSKVIQVYRFDGKSLVEDKAAQIQFDTRPGAITTRFSR